MWKHQLNPLLTFPYNQWGSLMFQQVIWKHLKSDDLKRGRARITKTAVPQSITLFR